MDDYDTDINDALRELKELRKNQAGKGNMPNCGASVGFTVSPEITEFIKKRREDSARMRQISVGVYS